MSNIQVIFLFPYIKRYKSYQRSLYIKHLKVNKILVGYSSQLVFTNWTILTRRFFFFNITYLKVFHSNNLI